MPAQKSSVYSMLQVVGTIDGQKIQGLWDGDDAVVITPGADVGALTVGADGSSIFSGSADFSATISVKLQHTSPTHRLLEQRLKQQRAFGTRIGFPVTIRDIGSGEGGATDKAFIQAAPADSKGKMATEREWTLVTGTWERAIPNVS